MDSLTHTVIGACLGEALAGKKLGKKAMLIGAIANNLPDIDVLSEFFLKEPDTFLFHRGFTHSFLFLILFTPLFAWLLKKIYRKFDFNFRDGIILIGSSLLLHIVLDSLTVYGTGWFEPFSHYRVALNILFIVDPTFAIGFLIASIALLILKKKSAQRKLWLNLAFSIGGIYLLVSIIIKFFVKSKIENEFNRQHLSAEKYFFTPTPFNNLLWYIVQSDTSGFNTGYYSVLDKSDTITFYLMRKDTLPSPFLKRDDVQKLIRFSNGYYFIENKSKELVVFNDLRFGQIGGWYIPDAPFVFSYNLFENKNSTVIQQGRMKASSGEALKKMFERMKGN
jgi:inner membrane protein